MRNPEEKVRTGHHHVTIVSYNIASSCNKMFLHLPAHLFILKVTWSSDPRVM